MKDLDKYIGKYSLKRRRVLEVEGIKILSPENLIGVKIYACLTTKKGNKKHPIDIYTMIRGEYEIDLEYLLKEVIPYVSKMTEFVRRKS